MTQDVARQDLRRSSAPRGGRADCSCGGGRRAGAHCCSLQATAADERAAPSGGAGVPRGGRADCGCGGGRRAGAHCCSLKATAESLFLFLF